MGNRVLAALKTVPVHVGVLQAAVVLLEAAEFATVDETARETVATTITLLRVAMKLGSDAV